MGAPTGDEKYDSRKAFVETVASMVLYLGAKDPYIYMKPTISPLPNELPPGAGGTVPAVPGSVGETALTVPSSVGETALVVPGSVGGTKLALWNSAMAPVNGMTETDALIPIEGPVAEELEYTPSETGGKSGTKEGPYAYLKDEPTVGPGKDFTAAQKQKMLEENMKRNGGVVKSDNPNDYYDILTKPKKSMKGVTPDPSEWQFDHIVPKDKGGSNSYSNCQIISRKYNRKKWNKEELIE